MRTGQSEYLMLPGAPESEAWSGEAGLRGEGSWPSSCYRNGNNRGSINMILRRTGNSCSALSQTCIRSVTV